jgi:hypothetical protein
MHGCYSHVANFFLMTEVVCECWLFLGMAGPC